MANGKSPLKILGPEIIGLFLMFALILGVLNYFNILSLSTLYPKYFSSLPHQPLSQTTRIQNEKFVLVSPAKQSDILKIKEFEGKLLYYLKDNARLYAAIDGVVTQGGGSYGKINPPQSFSLLWITNDSGQKIEYEFIGETTALSGRLFSRDEKSIAQIRTEVIKDNQNTSLVLTLYDKSGAIKALSVKDLETRK